MHLEADVLLPVLLHACTLVCLLELLIAGFAVAAYGRQVRLLHVVGVQVAPAQEVVHSDPAPRLRLHLAQGCYDAWVGLLTIRVHAGAVHGAAEADDDVVLGHGVAVLVDLVFLV